MRRTAMLTLTLLAIGSALSAQMIHPGGGFGGGMMGGIGGSMGGGLAMSGFGGGMDLSIAPDGTVLVPRTEVTQASFSFGVVALTPAGVKAWTYESAAPVHRIDFAGSLALLASTGAALRPGTPRLDFSSELVALNVGTGSVAWKLPLDGMAMAVQGSGNQIYVVVISFTGDRKLLAVSTSGQVLWTQTL